MRYFTFFKNSLCPYIRVELFSFQLASQEASPLKMAEVPIRVTSRPKPKGCHSNGKSSSRCHPGLRNKPLERRTPSAGNSLYFSGFSDIPCCYKCAHLVLPRKRETCCFLTKEYLEGKGEGGGEVHEFCTF